MIAPAYGDSDAATIAPPAAPDYTRLAGPPVQPRTQRGTAGGIRPAAGTVSALQPGDAFGARYRILRTLGAGGMGVVYHSWDDELGVAVALKVIRPEVLADAESAQDVERRFKRELLLARQVTHKNVVRIHDIGDVEGVKYLTMPFVEGRDLASILKEGPVPVPRALRFARQIAAGLQAAHDAGVVHRDLKPENIMIDDDDQALIMDFGISRSMSGTGAGTMLGSIVGTLEYMAPEQGRGMAVDHRADIYSFGLLLYDMLAGRHRLDGVDNPVSEMMSRIQAAPPPLRSRAPEVPDALERIVSRCLQPDPAQRYAQTAELVADLERLDPSGRLPAAAAVAVPGKRRPLAIAGIVILLVAVAAAAFWWRGRGETNDAATTAPREQVSVLIADFDNRAGDPVFEGALEQALAIAMEASPHLSVYSQRTARALAPQVSSGWSGRLDKEISQLISRREGIRVLVAGTIDRSGNGYRLALRASDPADDKEIATAERTVSSKADVLQAIGSLADRIRQDLGESRTASEQLAAAETFTAGSLEAMRAYARGQDLLNAGKYQEALDALQQAVTEDPQLGRAYAAMGAIYSNRKQTERAETSFQEAMKHLDRMSSREKYRTLATYYIGVAGNYEKAIENYEALLKTYPSDTSWGNLAFAYLRTGNVARAREVAGKGLEIYPKNLLQRINYAAYAAYAGDSETGAREAQRVLSENPQYEFAYLPLALARISEGNLDAARAAYGRMAAVNETGKSLAATGMADIELYLGRSDAVPAHLTGAMELDRKLESTGELASKHVLLAEAQLAGGNAATAAASAKQAVAMSSLVNVVVPAAGVLIEAGQGAAARAIANDLEKRLQNESTAYAKAILGQLALKEKNLPEARTLLADSIRVQDTWLARFLLGRAYFEAGSPQQALDDWTKCHDRRGETLDLFFADSPSSRYLPPLYYWLGRANESVGSSAAARRNYEQYMKMRGEAARDPLLADAQRRLAALK